MDKEQKAQERLERDLRDAEDEERQREEARAARKEARRKIRDEETRAEEERMARHKQAQPRHANHTNALPDVPVNPRSWSRYDEEEFYFNELVGHNSQLDYKHLDNGDVDFVFEPHF